MRDDMIDEVGSDISSAFSMFDDSDDISEDSKKHFFDKMAKKSVFRRMNLSLSIMMVFFL